MTAALFLIHLHNQFLVVRYRKLGKGEYRAFRIPAVYTCHIIIGTQRINHLLLHGRTLHHLFVNHLERNEIHVKGHVRGVLYLGMEIKKVIMGVQPFEQILDTETLAADMTDTALVILIHGFHDKTYQTG